MPCGPKSNRDFTCRTGFGATASGIIAASRASPEFEMSVGQHSIMQDEIVGQLQQASGGNFLRRR